MADSQTIAGQELDTTRLTLTWVGVFECCAPNAAGTSVDACQTPNRTVNNVCIAGYQAFFEWKFVLYVSVTYYFPSIRMATYSYAPFVLSVRIFVERSQSLKQISVGKVRCKRWWPLSVRVVWVESIAGLYSGRYRAIFKGSCLRSNSGPPLW